MCIAILTTPGKMITAEVFRRCFANNKDGVGFAWINKVTKEVEIDKGWMVVESALKKYHDLLDRGAGEHAMLIHFRAATVGRVGADNCHPFKVKGGAMIHNGTFWYDNTSDKADSRILAETMHNQLHVANVTKNKEQFDEAFGYNRVAFLYKGGEYVVFGEEYEFTSGKFGQWKNGVWYSNGGWCKDYSGYYGDEDKLEKEEKDSLAELDRQMWDGQRRFTSQYGLGDY